VQYKSVTDEFEVVYEPEDDGGYHVYCPALKGCHSYGKTKSEARENIAEAIELWLESTEQLGLTTPDREALQISLS
jgi:predicted RNase H-like HicB family nuclease